MQSFNPLVLFQALILGHVCLLSNAFVGPNYGFRPQKTQVFAPMEKSRFGNQWTVMQNSQTTLVQGTAIPRIGEEDLNSLSQKGYVVIRDFIPNNLVHSLQNDVQDLRQKGKFRVARIGQDSTNTLNTEIRVAETCFIGPDKLGDCSSDSRSKLYTILDTLRSDLSGNSVLDKREPSGELVTAAPALDVKLSETLYAYYPEGGFYRRHRDAITGSASVLRKYSLLLYLNENWSPEDGGKLRLHM
jgi:hypothetical protein